MAVRLESPRLLLYRAGANATSGLPLRSEVSIAKIAMQEALHFILYEAIQIHGSHPGRWRSSAPPTTRPSTVALDEAGRLGISRASIFSSGFAEAGGEGRDLQERLQQVCRRHGIQAVGPNCVGMIGVAAGFVATFAGAFSDAAMLPGSAGLISVR